MKQFKCLLLFIFCGSFFNAQVGINTTSPDPSSVLDIRSGKTLGGLLTPRMTTLERNSIPNPAESLLVFDTDLKAFYYYNTATTSWLKLGNDLTGKRDNYKLIKSEADLVAELAAGGGTNYLLDTHTYYEINGTINLAHSINLNNAYVSGLDANEDVLVYSGGTIFKGNTGGSVRNLTLLGQKAFDITGPGIATSSSLLVQNTIIVNMTTSVGSVSGLGLFFGSINQFVGNANGITYSNIGNLLLSNQAWLASNNGAFETFTGTFGLIEKNSGFSTVDAADVAIDVSMPGLIVGKGIIQGSVFSGTTTATSGIIKGYAATSTYPGYNFNTAWSVDAPGIPKESDDVASGNLFYNSSNVVTINNNAQKLPVNTDAIRLFRTAEGLGLNSENRIIYDGENRRSINILGAISFTAIGGTRYTFSIYKKGIKVIGSDVVADVLQTNARQSVSIICTADVVKNDYLEIYVQKSSNQDEQFLVTSYNLIVN